MKTAFWILVLITATTLLADDIKTLSGITYKNITVTRVDPNGISISHDDGLAKIPFANLPQDLQTKYGYDPKKAAAFTQLEQIAAAQAASAARAAAARDAVAAEAASKKHRADAAPETISIGAVATDFNTYVGKPAFWVHGYIDITNKEGIYFGNEYFKFEICDKSENFRIVFGANRTNLKTAALRKIILERGKRWCALLIRVSSGPGGTAMRELLDWAEPPEKK